MQAERGMIDVYKRQTLWDIARNEYGDTADIRKIISEICAENDLSLIHIFCDIIILCAL